ncbi:hypothetical protein RB195_013938 [Necator americanus]|uniref:Uncharacterized protein n=1 Tax=Necator americanus TaxID=51031 RepID=A0ABR1DXZ0_NECAM
MTDSATGSGTKVAPSVYHHPKERSPVLFRRPSGPNDLARFRPSSKTELELAIAGVRKDAIPEERDDEDISEISSRNDKVATVAPPPPQLKVLQPPRIQTEFIQ